MEKTERWEKQNMCWRLNESDGMERCLEQYAAGFLCT